MEGKSAEKQEVPPVPETKAEQEVKPVLKEEKEEEKGAVPEEKANPEEVKKLMEENKMMFDPKNLREDQVKSMFENLEKYVKDPKGKAKIRSMKEMAPLYAKHAFWDTQPVPKFLGAQAKDAPQGELEKKELKDVRPTPYPLPETFEWSSIDLTNDKELNEVYELLKENYVEDSSGTFRFRYTAAFLKWALTPPGYHKDWIVGLRVKANKKMVGFISGIPLKVTVEGKTMNMAEINFLCVHSKLRTKRMAPVLIKEVTRRINLKSVWQAVYTAGKYIPTPISESNYYYRCINFKKLLDVGFVSMPPKSTLKRQEKIHKVPESANIPGLRKMTKKDATQVQALLADYLKKFTLHPEFSVAEVKHMFTPKEEIVDSYVVEDAEKKITDFISFYMVPCSALKHETIKEYKGGYMFYYAANKTPLQELVKAALVQAAKANVDVFFGLNVMDNGKFFEDLRFVKGSGKLMYYLFNYAVKGMSSENLGIVLV